MPNKYHLIGLGGACGVEEKKQREGEGKEGRGVRGEI